MAQTQSTLINGQAYNFVDVQFQINGVSGVPGFIGIPIKSISYKASQTKTALYENSKYATAYSYGKKEYSGTVTFTLDSMELLRDAIFALTASSRSITDLPATDVVITFVNKGKKNVHTIHMAAFTSEDFSGSEGDASMNVTCNFISPFIEYGDNNAIVASLVLDAANTIINDSDNQSIF